jgi:hypothetical protein
MADDVVNTNTHDRAADVPADSPRSNQAVKAMGKLLAAQDGSFDDKIATVKTAQFVDKGRFETAFKTLMKR